MPLCPHCNVELTVDEIEFINVCAENEELDADLDDVDDDDLDEGLEDEKDTDDGEET